MAEIVDKVIKKPASDVLSVVYMVQAMVMNDTVGAVRRVFAHLAVIFIVASIVYMIVSKICLKAPFKASLTDEQKKIMCKSKKERSVLFALGSGVGFIVSLIFLMLGW